MKNFIRNTIQSQKVFYRYFRRKGLKRFFKENVLQSDGSNKNKALSIALGVFVGITPLWGFHTVTVLFLASVFRLNKLLAFMFTNVSFPPLIPFIIGISFYIGSLFIPGEVNFEKDVLDYDLIKSHLLQYLIGSMLFAIISAATFGLLSYVLLTRLNPQKTPHQS